MRAALRFLICLLISCSIALAVAPAPVSVPMEKADCCIKAKTKAAATDGCERHAPKSDQEKQCCAGCAFCVATLLSSVRPFVYPPTGEESFAAFVDHEQIRSHRPPVPPPRA